MLLDSRQCRGLPLGNDDEQSSMACIESNLLQQALQKSCQQGWPTATGWPVPPQPWSPAAVEEVHKDAAPLAKICSWVHGQPQTLCIKEACFLQILDLHTKQDVMLTKQDVMLTAGMHPHSNALGDGAAVWAMCH